MNCNSIIGDNNKPTSLFINTNSTSLFILIKAISVFSVYFLRDELCIIIKTLYRQSLIISLKSRKNFTLW